MFKKFCILILASSSLGYGSLASILEPLTFPSPEEVPAERLVVKPEAVVETDAEVVAVKKESEPSIAVPVYHVTSYDVIRELAKRLNEHYTLPGELKLSFLHNWKTISLKTDNYAIEFVDTPLGELRSNFNVGFRVVASDKVIGSWSLPVKCEVWAPIYYTKERINRGETLSAHKLKVRTVNVLKLNNKAVTEDADLSQYEASKTISAEKPLFWSRIDRTPHVRKGKVLDLVAEEGGLKISTKCIALQNGLIDEFIPVRNVQSRRDVQAQIINESTAKVYF